MKTIEQIETDKTSFSIGLALSDGWKLVSKNLLFYILGLLVSCVILGGSYLIPILGSFASSLILMPCLIAGGIYVTWQISNGKAWTDFGDMFKGFGFLTPLMVSSLIQMLVSLAIMVILFISYIPELLQLFKLSSGGGTFSNKDEIKDLVFSMLNAKTVILFLVAFLGSLFISIIWAFKSYFIVIYKLQAWPAMEASRKLAMKNFFELLGLFIILGLIFIVSALPCLIGLIFTLPWIVGVIYSAFAQLTDCNNAYDLKKEGFDFMKEE